MLKQGLQQKLLQKLSPQQIQLIKLLQVPTDALEERIKEEMESNPALEEGMEEGEGEDEIIASTDEESPEVEDEKEKEEETEAEAEVETETETEEQEEIEEETAAEAEDEDDDFPGSDNNELTDYMDEDEVAESGIAALVGKGRSWRTDPLLQELRPVHPKTHRNTSPIDNTRHHLTERHWV